MKEYEHIPGPACFAMRDGGIMMAYDILEIDPSEWDIIYLNGDSLDNRKRNLRAVKCGAEIPQEILTKCKDKFIRYVHKALENDG